MQSEERDSGCLGNGNMMQQQNSSVILKLRRISTRVGALHFGGFRFSLAPYVWLVVLYLCVLAALRSS
jgi:hypothetical protein